jgi:hypothetical protein
MDIFKSILFESLKITLLVLIMMIIVDSINTWTKGKVALLLKGKSGFRQYFIASFIGTIPGCIGGFTNVTLYIHGLISFGALAGSMISVSGDEAFVMLAMFPKEAILLFGVLFVLGIVGGKTVDIIVKRFKIKTCQNCNELIVHQNEHGLQHFSYSHIWSHIIKKHIWKIFLWTFFALLIVEVGLKYFNLQNISSQHKIVFLFLGALVGLIPESGPHLIFVTLFSTGLIPFSVLLTSSIVQDGHGMLPLLSYSLKDSVKIKMFNFIIGLSLGLGLFVLGF